MARSLRLVVLVFLGLGLLVPGAAAFPLAASTPSGTPSPPDVPPAPEDPLAGTNECTKINGWRYCVSYKAVAGCDLYVYLGSWVAGCVVHEMPV